MSTNHRGAADDWNPSARAAAAEPESPRADQPPFTDRRSLGAHSAPGAAGGSRKKRRRQRSLRGKRRVGPSAEPRTDDRSRERIFQDIEGLLRQIREQAEESANWTEDQLKEITHTVTSFTKSLEDEGDPVSERARSEYQRVREKLNQALRG